jgi:hypothetical protein
MTNPNLTSDPHIHLCDMRPNASYYKSRGYVVVTYGAKKTADASLKFVFDESMPRKKYQDDVATLPGRRSVIFV